MKLVGIITEFNNARYINKVDIIIKATIFSSRFLLKIVLSHRQKLQKTRAAIVDKNKNSLHHLHE
jgi:hypothetical protein